MNKYNLNYKLVNCTTNDIEILEIYKLHSVLDYANNLSKSEISKIKNYVYEMVPNQIEKYKLIIFENKLIGCLLVYNYNDGVLLDEIYLIEEYRNKGIGTDIILNIINYNKVVYLWVYKDNNNALKLYKKMGFEIIQETNTRYYMKCKILVTKTDKIN